MLPYEVSLALKSFNNLLTGKTQIIIDKNAVGMSGVTIVKVVPKDD